ncbi:SGNH hydrolase-type esterase domain-containing protein [Zychaea mexicana]|uniref:SGNH hydrolase-type esterase domain-containing protein n=1 Tax=Zychaea mexicana TaxID=64656 RepID=UPI0022FE178C|nr:SGNH hydrolase-type esterase domain-containing protein [Zychaea mexicana]XP_052979339.1 SGNH hydrolase-type esterase domain-containing protein [Zychaea mexicana]KAI9493071.1 SGNH hydrolase-type esterase domain-containing protein [Zychaea mexicana]KAI9493074.1 SGNH hydrolase-type esterase domain-containing protein [Zychaea mexicana]
MKTAVILSALCLATATSVSALEKIIAYADSFTDNGNDYKHSGFPVSPPYWKGRFSNGPTWLEYVADELDGHKVINFGHGGAPADNAYMMSVFNGYTVPGTVQQVEQLEANGTPEDLYIISIGYNDLNGIINPDQYKIVKPGYGVEDVTGGVVKTVNKLVEKYGAKHFLIQNCPPFWRWPVVKDEDKERGKELQIAYNDLTKQELEKIKGIDVQFQDISTFWNNLLDHPESLGLRTDNGPCNPGIGNDNLCDDPETHMYFDSYHPNKKAHKAWGEWAADDLKKRYDL